ncbi:hypothetical protein CLV76_12833 [Marivita geojedonensis]|nr:hypothetical protein CLV76_12833 [Marivita geojedonensis]
MPISFGPIGPEFCDGDTREEETCHRQIRNAEGGGDGVRSVLARGPLKGHARRNVVSFRKLPDTQRA